MTDQSVGEKAKPKSLKRIEMKHLFICLRVAQYLCLAISILFIVLLIPNSTIDPKAAIDLKATISSFAFWAIVFFITYLFLLFLIPQFSKLNAKDKSQKRWKNLIKAGTNSGNNIELSKKEVLNYCNDLIEYYQTNRAVNRAYYYWLQISTILLAGMTPVFVLINESDNYRESFKKIPIVGMWIMWLPVILPAIAAILIAISTAFPFLEGWINSKNTGEILEAEREEFLLAVTEDYLINDNDKNSKLKSIENFVTRINSVHLQELQNWAALQKNSRDERKQNQQQRQTEFDQLMKTGKEKLDGGKLNEAEADFNRAMEVSFDHISNREAAMKMIFEVKKAKEKAFKDYINEGDKHMAPKDNQPLTDKDYDNAITAYEKALALNVDNKIAQDKLDIADKRGK